MGNYSFKNIVEKFKHARSVENIVLKPAYHQYYHAYAFISPKLHLISYNFKAKL